MLEERGKSSELQKWEYCILNIASENKEKEELSIVLLHTEKSDKEDIKDKNPLQVIAELGENGWELVNIAPDSTLYFFKRPKI